MALRARRKQPALGQGVEIASGPVAAAASGAATVDGVTKSGTIIFTSPKAAIRDDGAKLSVSRGADIEGITEALRLARARYGETLTIEGSDAFKRRVAAIAATTGPGIRFTDPALERQRIAFEKQWQELTRERAQSRPADHAGRDGGVAKRAGARAGSPGVADSGSIASAIYRGDRNVANRHGRRAGVASPGRLASPAVAAGQSYVGGIGERPPPRRADSLRDVPELGVVHVPDRSEMLLPRHVHGDVEQPRTGTADRVRREVHRAGVIPGQGDAAVDRYIAERESKRPTMPDIKPHLRYSGESGTLPFMGTRDIDGQIIALFAKGDAIIVKAVDADEMVALPKARGSSVVLDNGKVVQSRSRGRGR